MSEWMNTADPNDPAATALVRFGRAAVRAYIESLPADDPERVAFETAMAEALKMLEGGEL